MALKASAIPSTKETAEEAANQSDEGPEHRSQVRYPVDGDALLLQLNGDQPLRCRLVDLSLQGCCLRGQQRMRIATGTRVEIQFKVNGIAFRFGGTIQWTDGCDRVGIRFPDRPARLAGDLKEVLAEVEAAAQKKAAEEQQRAESESLNAQPVPAGTEIPAPAPAAPQPGESGAPASAGLVPPPQPETGGSGRDRRAQGRESVDSDAAIFLVKSGARLPGRIVDLSMGGCGIRVEERFLLGIYTRVEVEFSLQGLPLRLAGVTQSIHDHRTVGIRFLDMSERKQAQVIELIAEIRSLHDAEQKPPVPPAS